MVIYDDDIVYDVVVECILQVWCFVYRLNLWTRILRSANV